MTANHLPRRLGLVVPGDCHVDDEFWSLAGPDAIPYVTRTIGADDARMGSDGVAETWDLATGPEIGEAARRLRDVAPAAVAYVDTSISFVRGPGGDTEIAVRIAEVLRCPAIVTSTAVVAAFRALGAGRIRVLSPYSAALDASMAAFLEGSGIEVAAIEPLAERYETGTTSRILGTLEPAVLVAESIRTRRAPADALFLPCTALRTLGAVPAIEAQLGIPVVTAVGATMWAILALAGDLSAMRPSAGRLFEGHVFPDPFATRPADGPSSVQAAGRPDA